MKKIAISILTSIGIIASNAMIINIPADYSTIQQGINQASNGDTVLIQPGTYMENINFNGKNIIVASLFLTSNDTSYIGSTIISSSNTPGYDMSVVTFENNETSSAKLIGLTIKNGNGNYRFLGSEYVYYGGGIYCNNASPILSHLIVIQNTAECGGGVFLYYSNAIIKYCRINNNVCNSMTFTAPNAGGGIAVWNCEDVLVLNNKIQNNDVERAGGAFYTLTSKTNIVNCLITGNHSSLMGSAFYMDSWSSFNITNSSIYGNLCDYGFGIRLSGMMYCLDSAKVKINNSIFYNNVPAAVVCQFNYSGNQISVSHSDFEGGVDSIITNNGGNNVTVNWLSGNLNTNPLFVNIGTNDFHLQPSSVCINAGDTMGIVGIPALDLDNNNRFNGSIDMGCFEFQGTIGINTFLQHQQIHIYPNPVSEYLIIESDQKEITTTLYDINGQLINSQKLPPEQNEIKIDVSQLVNGVYFLHFSDGQTIANKKIIVAH